MLPFLKPKNVASVIIAQRHPGKAPEEQTEDDQYDPMEAAAADLIRAVHEGNEKAVASALKAAFEICDSQPHEEGPHTNTQESE